MERRGAWETYPPPIETFYADKRWREHAIEPESKVDFMHKTIMHIGT